MDDMMRPHAYSVQRMDRFSRGISRLNRETLIFDQFEALSSSRKSDKKLFTRPRQEALPPVAYGGSSGPGKQGKVHALDTCSTPHRKLVSTISTHTQRTRQSHSSAVEKSGRPIGDMQQIV